MKAYQIFAHDVSPRLETLEVPSPARGEIRVKIAACGLNFADLLMQKGTYQDTPALPFVGGLELAGTVDALGAGVTGFATGQRVAVYGGSGGLAEYGCFDTRRVVALPDAMSFETAAGFLIAYGTSHVALAHKARLQAGETLLVTGAAGGVGLTAVEVGKVMGARVIACARGEAKLKIAQQAGADHLIDASDDLRARVIELGRADVVYDAVGGDLFRAAFRACNPEARLLPLGFAGGDVPQIPANHLMVKNLDVLGLNWGAYMKFRPEVIANSLAELFDWYAAGKLKPHISHILPLEHTDEGMALLRDRKATGKVVITIPD